MRKEIIENNRNMWFIQHIQKHLDNGDIQSDGKVRCTICNKDVEEIANDRFDEILEMIKLLENTKKK